MPPGGPPSPLSNQRATRSGVDAGHRRAAGGKTPPFRLAPPPPPPRRAPARRVLPRELWGSLVNPPARARSSLPPSQKVALAEDIIKHARNEPLQELGASILMTLTAHDPRPRARPRAAARSRRAAAARRGAAGLGRFLRAVVLMLKWGLPPTRVHGRPPVDARAEPAAARGPRPPPRRGGASGVGRGVGLRERARVGVRVLRAGQRAAAGRRARPHGSGRWPTRCSAGAP